jgi:hypothetical protein
LQVQITIGTKNPVDNISALVIIEIQGGFRQFVSIELRKCEIKHTNYITCKVSDTIFDKSYSIPYALSYQRILLSEKDGLTLPNIFSEAACQW